MATALADVRVAYERLVSAAADYDAALGALRATIAKRLERPAGATAAIAAERRRLDAAIDRYSEPVVRALAERARLFSEIARVDTLKKRAVDAMHAKKLAQLANFTARMNELLGLLCADFTLDEPEPGVVRGMARRALALVEH